MRITLILIFSLLLLGCRENPPVTTIAFGSCSQQESSSQLWKDINAEKPQVWIWGGDIIYGDSPIMDTLQRKYTTQKKHTDYQQLHKNTIITGTWDDHDYGVNDGGKLYTQKKQSQELFLDFMDVPKDDSRRNQEGVYSSLLIGSDDKQIKIINLDTRYHRDTLIREYYFDSLTQRKNYIAIPNTEGDILGEAQWTWLEKELNNSPAAVHIINSSIQVISEEHQFEKWANFPTSRKRLFDLIVTSKAKGILIISGDRHIAEISKIELEGLPYPLYDFTSSGLTHTYALGVSEVNGHRVGDIIAQLNYGLIHIDWNKDSVQLLLQVKGKDKVTYAQQTITFPYE
jgi:alkaline phosphatase D